jgi:replicative DNA helicase
MNNHPDQQLKAKPENMASSNEGARGGKGLQKIQPLLTQVIERIDDLYQRDNKSDVTGVATGFVDLDRYTSGLQPGALIILAGRPAIGKTTLAINIAEHVAIESGLPVAFFSMEIGGTQMVARMLGSVGRVDQHRIRTGKLTDQDWPRVSEAIQRMSDAEIYIDETPALSSMELCARARQLSQQCRRIGLILVDSMQLMSARPGAENSAIEVSRNLKALAKELNCPVFVLSQLNCTLEQRPNKRPVLSDLPESDAIEPIADVILFIYRDEVYNADSQDKKIAEIIIGKQRNGPTGTIRLTFADECRRFDNDVGNRGIGGGD